MIIVTMICEKCMAGWEVEGVSRSEVRRLEVQVGCPVCGQAGEERERRTAVALRDVKT